VTLFWKSPHNHHRVGSLGLNFVCEGLLLGMRAKGHRDPHTEAHTCRGNSGGPSPYDCLCNTPLYFLAGVIDHMMEPWPGGRQGYIGSGRILSAQGEVEPKATHMLEPPRRGRVIVRRSLVHWRSLHLVTCHSGHVSHPHSWGREIIVNYKGL
jgi:hypothetical protein